MSFVVLALALLPMEAFAQEAPSEEATAEMNRLNEEGFIEFRAGRYLEAAQRFRKAHEAVADPYLRKNEAVAWFKAGRCDEANTAANAFLIASDTSEDDRREARSIIANCRVEMAREAFSTRNWALAETLLDEAESLEPDQYALDQIAIARVELAELRKRPPGAQPGGAGAARTAGWIMVGTGAAVLVGTMIYWLTTIDDRKDSNELPMDDPNYESARSRANTSRWLVPVGLVAGAALGGLGVYFVVSGGSAGKSAPTVTANLHFRF